MGAISVTRLKNDCLGIGRKVLEIANLSAASELFRATRNASGLGIEGEGFEVITPAFMAEIVATSPPRPLAPLGSLELKQRMHAGCASAPVSVGSALEVGLVGMRKAWA